MSRLPAALEGVGAVVKQLLAYVVRRPAHICEATPEQPGLLAHAARDKIINTCPSCWRARAIGKEPLTIRARRCLSVYVSRVQTLGFHAVLSRVKAECPPETIQRRLTQSRKHIAASVAISNPPLGAQLACS